MSPSIAAILFAAVVSENYALSVPGYSVSLAYPLTMATLLIHGPAAAALVAASTAVNYSDIRRRLPLSVVGFNLGQLLCSTMLSGWTYLALGGWLLDDGAGTLRAFHSSAFPDVLVPLSAAAVSCAVANMLFTALGFALKSNKSIGIALRSLVALLPTQIALAFVGFLLAEVMAISLVALPLFVFPLAIARQVFQRYTSLKGAYTGTVRALVGALEAKDSYTRGHSERVAGYAVLLGRELGLDTGSVQRLEYAALLHDIGKLSLSQAVLSKPGRLSACESSLVRGHPQAGASMVGRIPPLRDLAGLVGQHHERVDGSGYPEGLAGEEIDLLAKILAVADAYDAMTSARPYRAAMSHEDATAELIAGAGCQFDPHMVRAFIHCGAGRPPSAVEASPEHALTTTAEGAAT